MSKRIVKSIAFNPDDPIERNLWEHAQKHSQFSAYIKRLIQRDKEGGQPEISHIDNGVIDDDKNAMESFL